MPRRKVELSRRRVNAVAQRSVIRAGAGSFGDPGHDAGVDVGVRAVRTTAPNTDLLLSALGSTDPGEAERARAALVARGEEVVPILLECLEGDAGVLRLRALSLLALFGNPVAASPVVSLLRHSEPAVRARAAGTLARLAAPSAVPALARLLAREAETAVRLAAARALVRLVQTGHDDALRPLFEVIADPDEDARVRVAALECVPWVSSPGSDGPVCAMLERLVHDGARPVAQKARRMLANPPRPRLESWAVDRLLRDLRSERLATWRRAISRLGRAGGTVVEPLLDALAAAPDDRALAERIVLVLKALSPRQLARLGASLDTWTAPGPLLALLEVAEVAGSRALLARVASLIERLAASSSGPGALDEVRQTAHAVLARHGSRLAIDDLHRLLEDDRFALTPEIVSAIERIGVRRDLPALLRAYRRSRGVNRLALRDAVLAICRRERIRRTERALSELDKPSRAALVEILGAPRRPARRRGAFGRIERAHPPLLN